MELLDVRHVGDTAEFLQQPIDSAAAPKWVAALEVPMAMRECFLYLDKKAAHVGRHSSTAQQSVATSTIEVEFQTQVEGLLVDDKDGAHGDGYGVLRRLMSSLTVEAAVQLMDYFVSPMHTPLSETLAKLLEVAFDAPDGAIASAPLGSTDMLESLVYAYLQRVRNVTVGIYDPLGDKRNADVPFYAEWQKLCQIMDVCIDGHDRIRQRRACTLLRYCVGVLEDDLVRKRATVRTSMLHAIVRDASTAPMTRMIASCIQMICRGHGMSDLVLVEAAQRFLQLLFCVYWLAGMRTAFDVVFEINLKLQTNTPVTIVRFCEGLQSMSLRQEVVERFVQQQMEPSTATDQLKMPLSLTKLLTVYMSTLPKTNNVSPGNRQQRGCRQLDYYMALIGLLMQAYVRMTPLVFADRALLAKWNVVVGAVRNRFASHAAENTPSPDLPPWSLTLDLIEATYPLEL